MSQATSADWLSDLALVAGRRRYPDQHLLYQGVVHRGSLTLVGKVDDAKLQQVQIEHFAGARLACIQVVPLRRWRFTCDLKMHRGHNDLVIGAFDDSGRAQARHLVYRSNFREWAEIFLVALCLAIILRAFVAQAFMIPSASMRPTLAKDDRILVDKFYCRFGEPRRGDLVVFDSPEEPGTFFIKRVVGIPGDQVAIAGSKVFLDGAPLSESYLDPLGNLVSSGTPEVKTWDVEPEHYFLLGDNRLNSRDSRVWGTLPRRHIVGRALLRYWPPHRMGTVE